MTAFIWFVGGFSFGTVVGVFFAGAYIQRCKRYVGFLEKVVAAREQEVYGLTARGRQVANDISRLGEEE